MVLYASGCVGRSLDSEAIRLLIGITDQHYYGGADASVTLDDERRTPNEKKINTKTRKMSNVLATLLEWSAFAFQFFLAGCKQQ